MGNPMTPQPDDTAQQEAAKRRALVTLRRDPLSRWRSGRPVAR